VLEEHIKAKRPGTLMHVIILFHKMPDPNLQECIIRSCNSFNEVLPHSPYSPDFSPCDHHVFGPMKKANKAQRFAMDGDVQEAITDNHRTFRDVV